VIYPYFGIAMSSIDLPALILMQVPARTKLADTRALMQRVQAAAEQEWEREVARQVPQENREV
jgi:hypothetical protein